MRARRSVHQGRSSSDQLRHHAGARRLRTPVPQAIMTSQESAQTGSPVQMQPLGVRHPPMREMGTPSLLDALDYRELFAEAKPAKLASAAVRPAPPARAGVRRANARGVAARALRAREPLLGAGCRRHPAAAAPSQPADATSDPYLPTEDRAILSSLRESAVSDAAGHAGRRPAGSSLARR